MSFEKSLSWCLVWIWLNSPLFLCHPINKTSSWSTIYSHLRHTDHSFLAILSQQVWAVQTRALRLGFSSEQNQHAWEETPPLSSRPAPRHQLQPHQNNNVIFSRQGKELELWRIISCWPCCRSSDVFYLPLIFLSSFVVFFFSFPSSLCVYLFTKWISSRLRNETIRIWITLLSNVQ